MSGNDDGILRRKRIVGGLFAVPGEYRNRRNEKYDFKTPARSGFLFLKTE